MKRLLTPLTVLYFLLFTVSANSYLVVRTYPLLLLVVIPVCLFIMASAGVFRLKTKSSRLTVCHHGGVLLGIFYASVAVSLIYHILLVLRLFPNDIWTVVWSALYCTVFEAVLFWVGIICVYCTSVQLGIKIRVLGALCGMIPIANLILLAIILKTVMREVDFEIQKEELNDARRESAVCKTKYPILFVHGVFFRDSKLFNYWGRIPKELENNGATVFYGEHPSALSVENSAKALCARIREIVRETGCEKLNIIAHSKGGLDCRYAIAELGIAPLVASLTTVNTPHRGCLFADNLLTRAPTGLKDTVARTYNAAFTRLGDKDPDFMAAVQDLTHAACVERDERFPKPEGILCQSIGSRLNRAGSGKFPLNLSYHLVKRHDGRNDGLVGEDSFAWGDSYTLLTVKGRRGISHADMIDLCRENIPEFDVREFYVSLVSDLKARGL